MGNVVLDVSNSDDCLSRKNHLLDHPNAGEIPPLKSFLHRELLRGGLNLRCLEQTLVEFPPSRIPNPLFKRADSVLAKKHKNPHAPLVNPRHLGELIFSVANIALIATDGINPNDPLADRQVHQLEHVPAILCLEQNILIWADEDWFAGSAIAVLAAPTV